MRILCPLHLYVVMLWVILNTPISHAQDNPVNFGEITTEELSATPLPNEKGAEAIVLYDAATANLVYSNGFKIEFTRHIRIKILKSSGFYLANLQIPYGNHDKLLSIRAVVHNLTGNVREKAFVSHKLHFREKIDPYHYVIRFTFPNIREGSVIEYSYSVILNEVWNYQAVPVQRSIPVRYFSYQFNYPEYFQYVFNYSRDSLISYDQNFEKSYFAGNQVNVNICRWTARNIPSFEKEYKMPENNEYILGLDFSLISVHVPEKLIYIESPTYKTLSSELLDRSAIGNQINNPLLFAGLVKEITASSVNMEDKMYDIYNYILHNIKWNGYEQLWPSRSLSRAMQQKTGSSAEINLILLKMLRCVGITAHPVALSTRDNGPVHPSMATAGKLNYLICYAQINGIDYLLDATDAYRPAGMLPFKCLNGQGWLLSKNEGRWINLLNQERYATAESYDLTLENQILSGHAAITFSGYSAVNMRKLIHEQGIQGFMSASRLKTAVISNMTIENQDSLHLPLRIGYDITIHDMISEAGDLLYFKPLISIYSDHVNSWIRLKRLYPVDFGCPFSEYVYCRIKIPERSEIYQMPESIRIRIPENNGSFTFHVASQEDFITLTGDLKLTQVFFNAEEYPLLREFYGRVSIKANEMLVLKKQ